MERLYYTDCYQRTFESSVVESADDGKRVYLEQSAFYPTSGGQPHDLGTLNGIAVLDVVDEGERVAHILETPLSETSVRGEIDWTRRFDLMQQHTGQHLLSAVLDAEYGLRTVAVHFGDTTNTIEVSGPAPTAEQIQEAESRANAVIASNRAVTINFEPVASAGVLRKSAGRGGELRIVAIEELDRCGCGGTHVRATGEIGCILLRKTEKIRGNTRIEFVCGGRAIARARADFNTLTAVARVFSSTLEDTPALVATLNEQARAAEKSRTKLAQDLAAYRSRELYALAETTANNRKVHVVQTPAINDEIRALAQGFTAQPGAIFIATSAAPPTILFAASADSGIHAGSLLKLKLSVLGGRGGGSATLAMGSLPTSDVFDTLLAELRAQL